jgi:hypothetical protein
METYPEMNEKIVGLLELSDEPMHLYAAQRIKELEQQVAKTQHPVPDASQPAAGYSKEQARLIFNDGARWAKEDGKGFNFNDFLNEKYPLPQPAALTNIDIIHKGIEFSKTLNADNESYLAGASFGYSCGYQAASHPHPAPEPEAWWEKQAKEDYENGYESETSAIDKFIDEKEVGNPAPVGWDVEKGIADLNHVVINACMNLYTMTETEQHRDIDKIINAVKSFTKSTSTLQWQQWEVFRFGKEVFPFVGHPLTCCGFEGCKREINEGILIERETDYICPCGKYTQPKNPLPPVAHTSGEDAVNFAVWANENRYEWLHDEKVYRAAWNNYKVYTAEELFATDYQDYLKTLL